MKGIACKESAKIFPKRGVHYVSFARRRLKPAPENERKNHDYHQTTPPVILVIGRLHQRRFFSFPLQTGFFAQNAQLIRPVLPAVENIVFKFI